MLYPGRSLIKLCEVWNGNEDIWIREKGKQKERMEESMSEVLNVSEMFGRNVFNDAVMKDRLPKNVYKKLKKTIEDGAEMDPSIADVVAHAMKDWAIERGATHYTTGSSL